MPYSRTTEMRAAAIAVSIANLFLLRVWFGLIGPALDPTAYRAGATRAQLFAAMISVTILGVSVWTALRLAACGRRRVAWIAKCSLAALFLGILNNIRSLLASHLPILRAVSLLGLGRITAAAAAGFAGLVLFALWRFRANLLPCLSAAALIAAPAVLLFYADAVWAAATYSDSGLLARPLAPAFRTIGHPAARVVWIVFDELDQALSYDARPKDLPLPELDSLRDEAFSASRAHSPAGHTALSMVALITGRPIDGVKDLGPGRLEARFQDGTRTTSWGRGDNVFTDASRLGYNTAVAGWYLPYCSVLSQLTACWWGAAPSETNGTRAGGLLRDVFAVLRTSFLLQGVGPSPVVENYASMYRESTRRACELAAQRNLGLVLLHLPGAHEPFGYDRNSGRWDRRISLPSGYLDALALVDQTLGEIRGAMAAAGEWDRTTVVVTGDHWFRKADQLTGHLDRRVPFVVKLAGQRRSLPYTRDFNTVETRDLLIAILQHEIKTPEEIAAWLDLRQASPNLVTDLAGKNVH